MNSGLGRGAFTLSALLVSRIGTRILLPWHRSAGVGPVVFRREHDTRFLGNQISIFDRSHCDRGRAAHPCGPRIASE